VRPAPVLRLLLAGLVLSGCAETRALVDDLADVASELTTAAPEPSAPVAVVSASRERAVIRAEGREVIVVPPEGYCLRDDAIETGDRTVFVLMTNCTRPGAGMPRHLLTASVSAAPLFPESGETETALDRLENFLRSAPGKALLARSDAAGKVVITHSLREDGALILGLEEGGARPDAVTAPRFLRAFIELDRRMVSLSVSSFTDPAATDMAMLELMRGFIAVLRAANAAPATAPAAG